MISHNRYIIATKNHPFRWEIFVDEFIVRLQWSLMRTTLCALNGERAFDLHRKPYWKLLLRIICLGSDAFRLRTLLSSKHPLHRVPWLA